MGEDSTAIEFIGFFGLKSRYFIMRPVKKTLSCHGRARTITGGLGRRCQPTRNAHDSHCA